MTCYFSIINRMERKHIPNPLKTKVERFKNNMIEKSHNIFMIRHAESQFNTQITNMEEKMRKDLDYEEYNEQKSIIRFNQDLCDCDITEKGMNQCYEAGRILSGMNVKYVFVSPLKRCLKTCENVINSMNITDNKPEIIVHPLIFEKIEDTCDLIRGIESSKKEYSHFNWSLIDAIEHLPVYQLNYCDNKEKTEISKENYYFDVALENLNKFQDYNHFEILIEAMIKLSKRNLTIESSKKTMERLTLFKSYLTPFVNKLKEEEKIFIFGHSVLFKHITTEFVAQDDLSPPEQETVLDNCEIAGLILH